MTWQATSGFVDLGLAFFGVLILKTTAGRAVFEFAGRVVTVAVAGVLLAALDGFITPPGAEG